MAMERGVYAQGWFARGYNYHPSLPPRRLKMAEDFAEYRATLMTWPSLGGGPISLAYLEDEAYAPIPARLRQYGFVKDSEFLDEVRRRGVKAFSVIFSTQGWEFPVELDDDESEILAMNELRGVGKRGWLGLREFTQNRYPKLWAPFEKYFPDGLTNSRGERVTDLFEECCSRDIHGNPHHARWLEVPAREHVCHYMDINNPVWREYLKAIARIHIDAGVDGIQFDEPDSPLGALGYGGSFSYDNRVGFTRYLQGLPRERIPASAGDLEGFDYGQWLLARGMERVRLKADGDEGVLARLYVRFLQGRQAANFAELSSYVREYAASIGRTVLVSSNLYDGAPWHDPLAGMVDVLVPEQRHTLYEQPGWMRYIAAFGGDKPVCVSTNPYGGVMPELLPKLNRGRALDRYRVMMYEATAMGVNMSVPYGAWMGTGIEDALWAPHDETVEIQEFLAEHDGLCSRETHNDVAVVYSTDSNFLETTYQMLETGDEDVYPAVGETSPRAIPFFRAVSALSLARHPLDVVMFHDGVHREDDADAGALARYSRLVLPGCSSLTARQVEAVLGYLDGGGSVTVLGEPGGQDGVDASPILRHAGTLVAESAEARDLVPDDPQLVTEGLLRGAVNLQRSSTALGALHIVNYDYDEAAERTVPALRVGVALRVPFVVHRVRVHRPGADPEEVPARTEGDRVHFVIPEIGPYVIVELN
ncbi:hypothetical protein [Naasia sp. SYSU D00057]|uniref:hypothetical protein n=1 Tax=Naasia sp. SYSU D00057 TaxID=2817380 RepID=UPI001B3121B3|nr:hypothetical protein [Naasia sp. SYSU D00057]